MVRIRFILLFGLTSAVSASEAPKVTSPDLVAQSAPKLSAKLAHLWKRIPSGAQGAVVLRAVGQDVDLVNRHGQRAQPIASVAKILISAAALQQLTAQYEFTTRVVGLGQLSDEGVIPGLGIIGGGSPALDEHHTDRKPDLIFQRWIERMKELGIKAIQGPVLIDAHTFSGPILPSTYPGGSKNEQAWYSAPASALAWNNNYIEVRAVPQTLANRQ